MFNYFLFLYVTQESESRRGHLIGQTKSCDHLLSSFHNGRLLLLRKMTYNKESLVLQRNWCSFRKGEWRPCSQNVTNVKLHLFCSSQMYLWYLNNVAPCVNKSKRGSFTCLLHIHQAPELCAGKS